MKTLLTPSTWLVLLALLATSAASVRASDDVVITEFMAENDGTVEDEDGDTPDWIELYNAGTNGVNLNGWYLTDTPGNLTRWRFPATNLPVNSFLLVFASNKDRRTTGQPLHTNFKLDNDAGYVALVKPDGSTVQSSFGSYAQQVAGVSYGLPVTRSITTLISNGSPARFTVPLNDSLGTTWTGTGFNDGSWAAVVNGVGFEGGGTPSAGGVQLADSVTEFSGTQGQANWFYGYWDKKADANGTYEAADFTEFPRGTGNTLALTNYWDGTKWDWPAGNPPWTELTSTGGHPSGESGNPTLPIYWTVRRYVSEMDGPLRLSGTLACSGQIGTCGDGVIGRILVDGVEVWQQTAFNLSVGYSIIVSASVGSKIDFVIDSGAANSDFCDSTTFTATVRTAGDLAVVADSINDWSFSGAQGDKNWFYGLYDRTADNNATYEPSNFVAFPSGSGPHSDANFWTGAQWKWFDGQPPFDLIGQLECMPSIYPSGTTNGNDHRIVRRWVSELTGTLYIDWHLSKKDLTGGGVIGRVYRNGAQLDTVTTAGNDFAGASRAITVSAVQAGDFIDFMVEPGIDVVGDLSFFNATIHAVTTLSNQFRTDVGAVMTNINSTAYLRLPFNVDTISGLDALTLRIKADDGFAAYLNGTLVASRNAPDPLVWNSAATESRRDAAALQGDEFNLYILRDALHVGTNVLAVQCLNSSVAEQDFLLQAELLMGRAQVSAGGPVYFSGPSPGSFNGAGNSKLGPLIGNVDHVPHEPASDEVLYVTARVSPTFAPLATVQLYYRVMFGGESSLPMLDDGQHGDGLPGDGVFGTVVPSSVASAGQFVRYYITATDTQTNLTRNPPFPQALFSSQYFGTVVKDPTLTNPLPVLHLLITDANLSGASGNNTARYQCSIYYLGEFYDNVGINRHGQSSTGFPKKSYDIDFNADHHFRWEAGQPRVDDVNLLTTYPDKAKMRNSLSYETYRDAGAPYHFVVPVRVQTNGGFFGDWHIVENGDANYLKRLGRDPDGSLYKMYNTFTDISDYTISSSEAEKKTRKYEGNADLKALYDGLHLTGASLVNYVYDNLNVSEVINVTAARNLTADVDCCHKNYYFYRDSNGTGEWEAMPWDVDLSFGRNWQGADNPATPTPGDGCSCYWDTNMWSGNYVLVGGNNSFWQAIFNNTATRQMYYRRLRTLMDEQLQPTNTPPSERHYEARVNELATLIGPDGQLDLLKWGTWGSGITGPIPTNDPQYQNTRQAADVLITNFLPARRLALYNRTAGNSSEIPNAQPTNAAIRIAALEYNPATGNQAQEFLQLTNPNTFAVDISGWMLTGAVQHTFQGGVVMAANSALYVSPDKNAFRARPTAPKGNLGLYIEGPYKGQLSARGETVVLIDKTGNIVNTNLYVGTPSGPQQWLRITEIMYHPAAPPSGSLFEAEDYEYIELRNTGPTNISLVGVHFANGIDFSFTGSAVTDLAPNGYVLVVRNLAAFTSRYGANPNVAGAYVGILDNGGENLRLDDAVGEKILDFRYENNWYPVTDGPGASLVFINPAADWKTWGLKASWRPSAYDLGSPASTDPPTNSYLPILVNEVLSHSDPPLKDAIELFNPNGVAVNIGGWFISDDLGTPRKFRVPNGVSVPAGGFVSFDETQFNPTPGTPPSFAFSSMGDEAYVFSGNGTNITGWFQGEKFGAAENNVSFGRYTNSQGNVHFVAMSTTNFGTQNSLPKVGPVVVSEIQYHPPDLAIFGDNSQDEFIELANISGAPVPLFDPSHHTNTWHVRGGVSFNFPTNVTLPANGYAVLISFYPSNAAAADLFRAKFSVPANVPLFGPFSGKLDNSAESVQLYKPDAPVGGEVPYVLVERIDYADQTPWPVAADGLGGSLQRRVQTAYGNDPTNWIGAAPTGGTGFVGGSPPVVTMQPVDTSVILGNVAMFSVAVSGTPPFAFQWQFNSNNIPGANSTTYTRFGVQMSDAGAYRVVVLGAGGSVESLNARLTVLIPASITFNPTNVNLRIPPDSQALTINRHAYFRVAATSGNPPITYQWRKNDTNIPAALNPTAVSNLLTISNVVLPDEGVYQCRVTDGVGTIPSGSAILTPLIAPSFLIPPVPNLTNPVATAFAVSVVVAGYPPPYTVFYRSNSAFVGRTDLSNPASFFTYPANFASRLVTSNWYRIVVSNLATIGSGVATHTTNHTRADFDMDGLPDYFEALYGLNTNDMSDAAGDLDGDTMSNLAEFIAGTDPSDPASYLKIQQNTAPGTATLFFGAAPGKTYTIQFTDRMPASPSDWNRLADFVALPTARVETVVDPQWTTNRFYRVTTPRQP